MSRDALSAKIASFETALWTMGCLEADFPSPNLRNEIHPVFHINRWMRGYGQRTREFYDRMKPALRLASLMLTEECMLWWWAHIHFGHLTSADAGDGSGRRYTYINQSREEYTGRREVRKRLRDMANVISFQFVPSRYTSTQDGKYWGVTTNRLGAFDWSHHFREHDYPPTPQRYGGDGRRWPQVALRHQYMDFYSTNYRHLSRSQILRVHFMFATTLVHELAHAYFMFIGRNDNKVEPYWGPLDPKGELGYSWEMRVLGQICCPLFDTLENCSALFSMKTYMWRPDELDKAEIVRRAKDIFYRREGGIHVRPIPLDIHLNWLPSHEWRGVRYYGADMVSNANFTFIAHGIPMCWVAAWFREEEWDNRRRYWNTGRQDYVSGLDILVPELGPSFSLIYEMDVWGRQQMYMASW